MAYVSHDKTLRNQGSWSLSGIWSHSWSATVCDMRDGSNIFACLWDFFVTGAGDELLLQPSWWVWDQTATSSGCQITDEGGFSHTSRTHGILVNEQQGPAFLQKEMLNAVIYQGTGNIEGLAFPVALSWHMNSTAPSTLRTTPNCKAKCYTWDWKSAVSLEHFMYPKPCSDLTNWNSGQGLAPAQITSPMRGGTDAADAGWLGWSESQCRLWYWVGRRKPVPACRTITPHILPSSQHQRGADVLLVSRSSQVKSNDWEQA